MGTVYYDDRSGKLVPGQVWQFGSADLGALETPWDFAYAELSKSDSEFVYECPINKKHSTGLRERSLVIDLFGKKVVDFVPISLDLSLVVSDRFIARLSASGLTGFAIKKVVQVAVNQCKEKDPRLALMEITGKAGRDHRWKIRGAPNRCPFCGHEPLICPTCGFHNHPCVVCDKPTLMGPDAKVPADDRRLRIEAFPEVKIVEGTDWDGSDWFMVGGMFISDRAKEWLERTHTFPIDIKPALLNVQGMKNPPK
jgi:hypothetical protein